MRPSVVISWIIVIFATEAASTYDETVHQCCSDYNIPRRGQKCSNGIQMSITCADSLNYGYVLNRHVYKLKDGSLAIDHSGHDFDKKVQLGTFCTGIFTKDSIKLHTVVLCNSDIFDDDVNLPQKNVYLKLYSYFLLVSVIFLVATFIVYCAIPSLRDLQGKCLMCFVGCLAIGYFSLAILQQNFFDYNVSNTVCTVFGFWTYFWLLCTFVWLSLISFNIWYQSRFLTSSKNDKLWILYLFIGFGIPALFQIGAVVSHHMPRGLLNPNIGNGVCWFQGAFEAWIYFIGPMAILLFSNLIFFIMTTRILWIHYKDARPQPRIRTLRFKMALYLKLFLCMGLTWIFELISYIFHIDWYVSDVLNSLQGPIIFMLMVLTRKRVIRTIASLTCCFNICHFCTRPWDRPDEEDDSETEAVEDIQLN